MPAITFVLPVYNMEHYLPRVADSLKAQTLTDFEAILVNDGSRDQSGAICAQLAEEDHRFCFIDQPNGGVAKARNAALDIAKGEYICFVDPDDWIEPTMAEVLYTAAKKDDADMVLYGLYHDVYDEAGHCIQTSAALPSLSGTFRGEPFKQYFDHMASSYLVIDKMMRRSYVEQHHLRFPDRRLGEDGLFYVGFYRHNPSCLVVIDKPLYHYTLARNASLSNSYHPERLTDNFYLSNAVWDVLKDWGLQNSPLHRQKAYYCTVRDLQMGIKNVSIGPLSFQQKCNWLHQTMQQSLVAEAVRKTSLHSIHSRNDRIKLFLLKVHLYHAVLLLSATHQNKGKKK